MQIDKYLENISDDAPCGEYLKYDKIYDDIREAKREDDPRLPQGVWKTELKKANWKKVIDLCDNVLQTKSKDLQILAWYAEAMSSLNGWEGMYDGLELFLSVCDKFWENIYPLVDGDDYDYRMAPIVSLITRLSDISLLIPVTQAVDDDGNAYRLADWIEARHNSKITQNGAQSFSSLHEAIATTDDKFLITTEHFLQKIINVLERLNNFLNDKASNDAPSFATLRTNINEVAVIMNTAIEERGLTKWQIDDDTYSFEKPKHEEVAQNNEDFSYEEEYSSYDEPQRDESSSGGDPLSQATLDQAFAALKQISMFIEQKDPLNPAPSFINVALQLKDKSFAEIMSIQSKDGEPIVLSISKIFNALKENQPPAFDKSIFDEKTE